MTMKKLLLISILGLTITSCVNDPISSSKEGLDMEVDLLFEKDGIKMYRFFDNGHFHYYTNRGETITNQQSGRTTYQENIK
jgi:hypothetical protein